MTQPLSYREAMAFIHERSGYDRGFISNPFAGDDAARLGLIRTERVLEFLSRPDRSFPILHVAGSKGKGSTSTFLDAILRESGMRSGRFLSPHLHRFNERFSVNDQEISDGAFAKVLTQVREAVLSVEAADPATGEVTAWEISTAIAFQWFAQEQCDVAVIEVGMGGMLDATNVIQPAASLITRLDLEHTAVLGDTLAKIAVNKAGIIKSGAPAFTVEQSEEALSVLRSKACQEGTTLAVAGVDWKTTGTSDDFSWTRDDIQLKNLVSNLVGQHQVENAGLAIAALDWLRVANQVVWPVSDEAIRRGLATASIIGRFEVLQLDKSVTVVLDGAHSPASTAVLADAIREQFPSRPVIAVIAMLADKSPEALLSPLMGLVSTWFVAAPTSPRALAESELLAALSALGTTSVASSSVATALEVAVFKAGEMSVPPVILVTGSLSTVAEARSVLLPHLVPQG